MVRRKSNAVSVTCPKCNALVGHFDPEKGNDKTSYYCSGCKRTVTVHKLKGGDKVKKPEVHLIGENGNIFNLMGLASRALKKAGLDDQVSLMLDDVKSQPDYDHALVALGRWVEID